MAVLPYDAEVEYLESTGTQWIDTGLYPTNNATTVVDVQLTRVAVANDPCRIHIVDSKESWSSKARTIGYLGDPGNTSRIAVGYGSSGATPASYADATNYTTARMKYTIARNVFTVGNLYAHTFAEQAFTSTVSMKLLINAAASVSSTAAKLYGWKHYENGVLLQDCIPVRVGSVGYVYDRVSGQLLGNAGTGSFVLGEDKPKPLAGGTMMIANRESFAAAARRGWRNPYVTDGLVAMWDGVWNAGPGVHDANAATWADLCGLTPLSFETPAAITVMPDAMRVDYSFSNNRARALSGRVGFAGIAQTVELCVTVDSGFTINQDIFMGPYSANGSNTFCVIALNRDRGFIFNDGAMYGTSANISATIAWTGSAAYKNAVALEAHGSNNTTFVNDGYITSGATTQQKYNIHSLRLYSRALTAAEIAANSAIDKARFNLP